MRHPIFDIQFAGPRHLVVPMNINMLSSKLSFQDARSKGQPIGALRWCVAESRLSTSRLGISDETSVRELLAAILAAEEAEGSLHVKVSMLGQEMSFAVNSFKLQSIEGNTADSNVVFTVRYTLM